MRNAARYLESIGRHPELFAVAFMVAIVGALVIPLPPFLLDLLLVTNLGLSLTLLVAALHLRGPLGLSSFPTLLLVATLFRLALNVSSTRLILGEGAAGRVIAAFGEFVVGGSYLVGAVVFVIVLIVQLLVVAKGAERVAEVGARFTLDALPGKQMAIDADLRAGACDQDEARRRRGRLEMESQFYGSLDGAMKFVKGDAIAGLLITAINVMGGLTVGSVVHGMPAGEAAAVFTLLSIGDGLVSQLPALLTAVAAGLVVTQVGTGGRLGADVVAQLGSQPRALVASGVVLCLLGLMPGLPPLPFIALGSAAAVLGARRLRAAGEDDVGEEPSPCASREMSMAGLSAEPTLTEEKLPADAPIVLVLDAGVSEEVEKGLQEGTLPGMRRRIASSLGLPLPEVPLVRTPRPGDGFEVLVHDIPAFRGSVGGAREHGAALVAGLPELEGAATGVEGSLPKLPADTSPAPPELEGGRAAMSVTRPEAAVATEVEKVVRERAGELLALETVQGLLDLLEKQAPALVREMSRRIPVPLLWEVLCRLLEEGVSIRPLERIAQALIRRGEAREGPASAAVLSEQARQALGRLVVHETSGGAALAAVLLDPLLEDLLRKSRHDTADGAILALLPEQQGSLLAAMRRELRGGAVLLAPADLRRQLWALSRGAVPETRVLAYQELPTDARVQPISRLTIDGLDPLLLSEAA